MGLPQSFKLPYVIVNAFTRGSFGGNPAAIVLFPPGSLVPDKPRSAAPIDDNTMTSIATSFAQPITVYVALSSDSGIPSSKKNEHYLYDIRFFSGACPFMLCGHGTLATAKAICGGILPGLPRVAAQEQILQFRTACGTIVAVKALNLPLSGDTAGDITADVDSEFYELSIPGHSMQEVTGAEREIVQNYIAKALRRDPANLVLKYVGHGTGELNDRLMISRLVIVLAENEQLEGRDIDINAFLEGRFVAYTLTHATPGQEAAFVSRTFAPAIGLMEDHVCGTAHSLLVPYYTTRADCGVVAGEEVFVKQVSPRGGDLWVTWDEENGLLRLRGNAKVFARGEITL